MLVCTQKKIISGVFITFAGNCRKALHFYRDCFGGTVEFELFNTDLQGIRELPVVRGSLLSERIAIYGSDLVHNEGRRLGNYMSVFLPCSDCADRDQILRKLSTGPQLQKLNDRKDQSLIELIDPFDVRWVLAL